jgi:hypothetical protein
MDVFLIVIYMVLIITKLKPLIELICCEKMKQEVDEV